ncbi:nuclear transport factor 2 family protein [Rhodococcus artemisiae]|uniref:Nuclear transport factor 2 family protein n=1 Tax=Rhodococcus artemisiae TaxID=714159 RepID=A0ABU7L601_9NOCA|nr:nuclear transport factor 2 family protein [Rhodococcus artemisiae]MEE2056964.1 nuclear transport factor 2 family protein [Rhodococcus artemisiae]
MSAESRLQTLLDDLVSRVTTLESERAASGLMHRYAALLDNPAPESLASLFTDDGVLATGRGTHSGRDEIAGFFRSARAADDSDKRHFICQPELRAYTPDRVRLQCYFGYTARAGDGSGIGWGTYTAEVCTDSGEALFESLTIDLHVGTDLERGWGR